MIRFEHAGLSHAYAQLAPAAAGQTALKRLAIGDEVVQELCARSTGLPAAKARFV